MTGLPMTRQLATLSGALRSSWTGGATIGSWEAPPGGDDGGGGGCGGCGGGGETDVICPSLRGFGFQWIVVGTCPRSRRSGFCRKSVAGSGLTRRDSGNMPPRPPSIGNLERYCLHGRSQRVGWPVGALRQ